MNDIYNGDLLVIVGPTAVGKTALSLELAETFMGEIISGDSMQVYRGMDIGTAKATRDEREAIPHHLIDIRDPDEAFSVADFQSLALSTIQDIQTRGKLPILVGGTGLYVQSVIHYPRYTFSTEENRMDLREKWERFAEEYGGEALWEEVRRVDPATAERLHPNDHRRLVRALEVYETTGKPMSQWIPEEEIPSPFKLLMIGLTMPRELLYQRINIRVEKMVEEGLIEEVAGLLDAGIPLESTAMQSLGYKEVIPYLYGKATLEETIVLIQKRTRQFAKRQLTWFRKIPEIHWVDVSETNQDKILKEIKEMVAGKFQLV